VTAWCSIDEAVHAGELSSFVTEGLPLGDAVQADTRLEDRKVAGRLVLCPEELP
jgi:hypothetical protein